MSEPVVETKPQLQDPGEIANHKAAEMRKVPGSAALTIEIFDTQVKNSDGKTIYVVHGTTQEIDGKSIKAGAGYSGADQVVLSAARRAAVRSVVQLLSEHRPGTF